VGLLMAEEELQARPPSRRVIEAVSWRLATELIRRHAGDLRLVETHGGGGQYDELRLYPRSGPESATFLVSLNRLGSAHFSRAPAWGTVWIDAVAAEDPRSTVDELERRAGLHSAAGLPAATADVLTFRAIAMILSHTAFEPARWECRSGVLDSSGYGGGPRDELFRAFPTAGTRRQERQRDDLLDEPAHRFWFLLRNSEPQIAFEDTGLAWTLANEQFNLVSRYQATGRLWPVVSAVAGPVLA
jgi:hypothetical protein